MRKANRQKVERNWLLSMADRVNDENLGMAVRPEHYLKKVSSRWQNGLLAAKTVNKKYP